MPAAPSSAALQAALPVDAAGLRAMKRRATALLAAVAGLFVVTSALPDGPVVALVRTAAEAGTVGGLADWFAVTALFRHPLGVPVPHTALVPRKKDELATRLGEFVTGNFLTADAVEEQLREARVVPRAAALLAEPATTRAVSREVAAALAAGLDTLEEGRLTAWVLELARADLARRSYAPVLGAFLARAVEGGAQRPLVDVALTRTRAHLEAHGDDLAPHVQRMLEVHWASIFVDTAKLARRLVETGAAILRDAEADPEHALRTGIDDLLARTAADLRYSPRASRDLDARLRALLDDPQAQALLSDLLADLRGSVRASLTDVDGDLAARLADLVSGSAARVAADPDLQERLEARLVAAARWGVEHYGRTAVVLVQRVVAGWEARDASARIEASVGRDLQFIRINGTVVGALAGVVLHGVGLLVG